MFDKIARTPQGGIRASPNLWMNPITSAPAEGEAKAKKAKAAKRRTRADKAAEVA